MGRRRRRNPGYRTDNRFRESHHGRHVTAENTDEQAIDNLADNFRQELKVSSIWPGRITCKKSQKRLKKPFLD